MRFILVFFILFNLTFADENATEPTLSQIDISQMESLNKQVEAIDSQLKDNIWLTRYSNFITYQELVEELGRVDEELKTFAKKRNAASRAATAELEKRQETLERQIDLLSDFQRSPFAEMIRPPEVPESPKIGNPLAVLSGISYIKQLHSKKEEFNSRLLGLELLVNRLGEKEELLEKLLNYEENETYLLELESVRRKIGEFQAARDISVTTFTVFEKKSDEAVMRVTSEIKEQMKSALNIGIFIIVILVLSFLLKLVAKRYIKDNERFYMTNKAINFINVTLIVLILLFAYIENVTYLVTVVGFASAGLAIAMKDMFMSLLGWIVIMIGGSFHVGNRIKVEKDGVSYVGDIIDISLLRMTVFEDITLTSYMENRRSGRIVFIPNNYIFTTLISNYTHMSMKTVWDGIDVTITFDSNHKKAMYLIKTITKKYSKGYTDIARKQLNMLRSQYSLKNTNVEPRIFSFLEPHGLTISTWYMTNSYAALALRSTLSSEIIEIINREEDITIAFPTQTIYVNDRQRKVPPLELGEEVLS